MAIILESGLIVWYMVMVIAFIRSILRNGWDGLTLVMALLFISSIGNAIWSMNSFFNLPTDNIVSKIGLDIFRAIIVTLFMWYLYIKPTWETWRKKKQ